jgi:hypothetical protein
MSRYLWALLLVGVGCAHTSPEERMAEQQRLARCAAIELYPPGLQPPRPYRIIGPLTVMAASHSAARDANLRDRACSLDADAVIDIRDEFNVHTNELPYHNETDVTSTGTAIAYIAETPAQVATPTQ